MTMETRLNPKNMFQHLHFLFSFCDISTRKKKKNCGRIEVERDRIHD